MRLDPLYTIRLDYPRSWDVALAGDRGTEEQHLLFAEGRCEGRVVGTFHAANYARRRTDLTFLTDLRGAIETADGATILLECRGFGRRHTAEYDRLSPGGRQWVATIVHLAGAEPYRWLNDVVCVGAGQVRSKPVPDPANPSDLVLEVAELLWESPRA